MFGRQASEQPSHGRANRWARWLMGLGLAAGGATAVGHHVQAQVPESAVSSKPLPDKSYMNKNPFYLPVTLDERTRNSLKEIHLYGKEDPSQPWVLKSTITPRQTFFNFKAGHDGEYWFTLVTVDKQGKASPLEDTPNLIVQLDTQAPQVSVSMLPDSPDGKMVQVDVRDFNLDASKTQFLYQTGNRIWQNLEAIPNTVNQFCIPRQAVLTGMVKTIATDLAGNSVSREFNLSTLPSATASLSSGPPPLSTPPIGPFPKNMQVSEGGPGQEEVILEQKVSETKFGGQPVSNIKCGPKEPTIVSTPLAKGPGPLSSQPNSVGVISKKSTEPLSSPMKVDDEPEPVSGGPTSPSSLPTPISLSNPSAKASVDPVKSQPVQPVSLNKQVVNNTHLFLDYQIDQTGPSGVGKVEIWLTKDQGQTWQKHCEAKDRKSPAELDLPGEGSFGISLAVANGRGYGLQPPASGDTPDYWVEVDVTKPVAEITGVRHASPEDNAMIISWSARDKNMGPTPIDLFFAIERHGPWHPIAKGLRNEGFYRWNVPGDLGAHAFIRLVATDQAGNVTQCESTQPVALDDLSRPRARPIGISTSPPTKTSLVPQSH